MTGTHDNRAGGLSGQTCPQVRAVYTRYIRNGVGTEAGVRGGGPFRFEVESAGV